MGKIRITHSFLLSLIIRAASEPENAPRILVLEEPTRTRLIA